MRPHLCCDPHTPEFAFKVLPAPPGGISREITATMVRSIAQQPLPRAQYSLTCFNALRSGSTYTPKYHDRHASFGQRLIQALADRPESMTESRWSVFQDERVWYDQFTSTDWVRDSIADSYRVKALQNRKDFWGKLIVLFDGAQGWILSAVVGFLVAAVAYCVDVAETTVFDFKDGYCTKGWYHREKVLFESLAYP